MVNKHAVIVTFPSSKWDVYGNCLRGFVEHWPSEVDCYAVVEQPQNIPIELPSNVHVIDFDEHVRPRLNQFVERNKDKNIFDMGTTGNIAIQAVKFAHKALAQLWVLENVDADAIWYLDGDLYTHKPVSMELLNQLSSSDAYIGCTPRWWKPNGYTETGLMMWRKEFKEQHRQWCELYAECYDKDKIFEFDAWHDCIAFDYATKTLLQQKRIGLADFGYGVRSSHPLVSGPLGKYFDHMKGKRKFVGHSKERIRVHGH